MSRPAALDGQHGVPGPGLEALDLLWGEDALLQPVGEAVDDFPESHDSPGIGRPTLALMSSMIFANPSDRARS